MKEITDIFYFDYNATTPIDIRVLDAMLPYLTTVYANAQSTHNIGMSVNKSVTKARSQVAELISSEESEIIFTSGSTEGINIALKGFSDHKYNKRKHIITVKTEHKAMLDTCKYLESIGYEITYLTVNCNGLIELTELKKELRTDTLLVSVMYVNNETGVIQPIKEISILAHEVGALFMTDASQAVGKVEIDVNKLGIDLMCISGHKMYAPKGIGALYIRNGIKITPFTHGGGHENGLRSGTLNVPGIVALGETSKILKDEISFNSIQIKSLRDTLEIELTKFNNAYINGSKVHRIYNVSNICFPGIDANILIGLMKNVAVSNGSACNAALLEPSHVLRAMGISHADANASIRFSLGKYNTLDEILIVSKNIQELIQQKFHYA